MKCMKYHGLSSAGMLAALLCLCGCGDGQAGKTGEAAGEASEETAGETTEETTEGTMELTEDQWRQRLSPEAFYVLRQKGTEPSYTGQYYSNKRPGSYVCGGCGTRLFSSQEKYDSGTGWPSFWAPAEEKSVATAPDNSFFSRQTEVLCSKCDGHLGHVFEDGPPPTGLRYCINAVSLKFVEADKEEGRQETSEP